jgi:hypothetical protein
MEYVVACGDGYKTNEHFVMVKLFFKRDQRKMFMIILPRTSRTSSMRFC